MLSTDLSASKMATSRKLTPRMYDNERLMLHPRIIGSRLGAAPDSWSEQDRSTAVQWSAACQCTTLGSGGMAVSLLEDAGAARSAGTYRAIPLAVALCVGGTAAVQTVGEGNPFWSPMDQHFVRMGHQGWHSFPWTSSEDDDLLTYSGIDELLPAAQDALARIRHLAELEARWDGTDVAAPNAAAIRDAAILITKLANAGAALRPRIGLESDGSVGFTFFREGQPIADMTIPGDDTYSYFAQADGPAASDDDAHLELPIPRDLLDILFA